MDQYEIIKEGETDINGNYSLILPNGKYDILYLKNGYLDYIIKNVEIVQQNTTTIPVKQIVPGDIVKDGVVKGTDLRSFLKSYGKKESDEGYEAAADYIEDDVIKGTDYKLFLNSYGAKKTIEEFE